MNIAQAKSIPIGAYLESQGHRPAHARQGGRELWYRSPIRDGDDSPSFKVDTQKNVWFDHGAATGGTIIDLVMDLCSCNVRDALRHLERTGLGGVPSPSVRNRPVTQGVIERPLSPARGSGAPLPQQIPLGAPEASLSASDGPSGGHRGEPHADEKENQGEKVDGGRSPIGDGDDGKALETGRQSPGRAALELIAAKPLEHPALLQYLERRGIRKDIARKYLAQIDFKAPESAGTYFALGYPAGGGYEARNALFKGFVGSGKAVTFHDKPNATCLQVFEGVMDFLSYLSQDRPTQPVGAVLVLNSTNLWRQALPYLEDPRFDEIRLYLDNDAAGDAATKQLFEHAPCPAKLADMRAHYAGFKDLNAWLLGQRP
jgi:hypothetical protein